MPPFRHLDLFSGIGGFALATEMVWDNTQHEFVEIDPFCHAVLKKHWPHSPIHGDIKTFRGSEPVDLVTGGFPCQPFSVAGKRKGTGDDRDLWPEMFRVIQETKPRWVLGENVAGFVQMELERSVTDLESAGYEVQALVIPAESVGAPHRRDRVWIVANASGGRRSESGQGQVQQPRRTETIRADKDAHNTPSIRHGQEGKISAAGDSAECADSSTAANAGSVESRRVSDIGRKKVAALGQENIDAPDSDHGRREQRNPGFRGVREPGSRSASRDFTDPQKFGCKKAGKAGLTHDRNAQTRSEYGSNRWGEHWFEVATRLCRMDDGVPKRVDRLKALGNAIVPQVAYEIMLAMKAADEMV